MTASSLAGAAEAAFPRAYYGEESGYYESIRRRPLTAQDDYEALKKWVSARHLTTVDAVLSAFGKDPYYRQYVQYPVFIQHSDSRQRAAVSPKFPRIVMHHPDSRLILAVVGNPAFPTHYRQIEIIELEGGDKRFAFHLADFQPGKEPFLDHPTDCEDCHGKPSRPIWGTYRLWTGAYGGFDDKIELPAERKLWDEFEKGNYTKGRYALLQGPPPRFHTVTNMGSRVNDMLNQVVGDLNGRRVAATLTESPAWPRYRYAMLSALKDCRDPGNALPVELREAHTKRLGGTPWELSAAVEKAGHAEFAARVQRYANDFGVTRLDELDNYGPRTDGGLRTNFDDSSVIYFQGAKIRYIADAQDLDPTWRLDNWSVSFDRHHPENFSFTGTEAALFDSLVDTYLPRRLSVSKDPIDRGLLKMDCDALEKAGSK